MHTTLTAYRAARLRRHYYLPTPAAYALAYLSAHPMQRAACYLVCGSLAAYLLARC